MSSRNVVIRNLYTSTANTQRRTYKNESQLRIELPFRALIIGKSGSMKSNLMFNLIELINAWTTIYIFAKNLEQPLYKTFIPAFEQAGGTIFASADFTDLPAIEDIENPERVLIIFDDLLAERNLTRVSDYFLRSRSLVDFRQSEGTRFWGDTYDDSLELRLCVLEAVYSTEISQTLPC